MLTLGHFGLPYVSADMHNRILAAGILLVCLYYCRLKVKEEKNNLKTVPEKRRKENHTQLKIIWAQYNPYGLV